MALKTGVNFSFYFARGWVAGCVLGGYVSFLASSATAETSFEDRVLQAILDNPEIVVLALGKLEEQREQDSRAKEAAKIREVLPDLFNDSLGEKAAVVEFFDYRCGYCSTAAEDVLQLEATFPESVIYVELPILGEDSVALSRFALAVKALHGADTYRSFHHEMMRTSPQFRNLVGAARVAAGLGLDASALSARAAQADISMQLQTNKDIASSLGIYGTPAFVGRAGVHTGSVDIETLTSIATKDLPS